MAADNTQMLFQQGGEKSEEVNYKKNFCERYFDKGTWDLDVLNQVDVLLKDRKGRPLLYIESKYKIVNKTQRRSAIAQAILTNKKQKAILSYVAIIYMDAEGHDVLELIDCSDDSVMYNNDINWDKERASNPTRDAIDRINDRVKGKITRYRGNEIADFYSNFKKSQITTINITERNISVVYNLWKTEVRFREPVTDEQDLINLFLVDLLNGTKYKKSFLADIEEHTLFGSIKVGKQEVDTDIDLIREGTNLNNYKLMFSGDSIDGIKYSGKQQSYYYTIADTEQYNFFWRKYKRPPEKHEFLKILERSSLLYTDKYRRDTGGEYTPACFVELQNQLLAQHYNLDDFIICDPCAGVGNLENQFGKDYKRYCYLSTLEQMDVDICRIKGFENAIKFDYLKDDKQPVWKYKGTHLDINEICRRENRKLMVVMNPPYQHKKKFKNNLAIEFFNKVLELKPQVIVFYYEMKSFFGSEIAHYVKSGYKIVSHVFCNAKDTFQLSEWPISQVIFDKEEGVDITPAVITADRYELDKKTSKLKFIHTYTYDFQRPCLYSQLKETIQDHAKGMILGNVSYLNDVIKIGNGGNDRGNNVTTGNLKLCLLSKGLIFNTHHKYFELNSIVYRGIVGDVPDGLVSDAIMFSLFYKGIMFSNKGGLRNYIMPFKAEELGCAQNDLNVLFDVQDDDLFEAQAEPPFDFRVFLSQFNFSAEAISLYNAALEVFKYYHQSEDYADKDYNDSFYDICNAIMGKDTSSFRLLENAKDKRITKVKTTKGTHGFSRKNIPYFVPSISLSTFERFFNARDELAAKINRQLIENGILLWERENIF